MEPTKTLVSAKHLSWVDIARGLGILAVVLWHTAGGIIRRDPTASPDVNRMVESWDAYGYRAMPLFFLISGMFVIGSLRRSNRDFVENKLRTLLWPYVLWSLISIVAGTIAGSASVYGISIRDVPRLLYDPLLQYWFLYALIAVMLGYLVLYRAALSPGWIAILAGGLYVITVVLDLGSVSYVLAQIGLFSVFFALGAALKASVIGFVEKASRSTLVVLSSLAAVALALLVSQGPVPPPAWLPFLSATAAMVGLIALAALLAGSQLRHGFALFGRYSLQIYVAQIIFASATRVVLTRLQITDFWPQFLLGSAVGLIGPLGLALLTERLHFPYLWSWPSRERRAGPEATGQTNLTSSGDTGP